VSETRVWTARGIARQQATVKKLRREHVNFGTVLALARGQNSLSPNREEDMLCENAAREQARLKYQAADAFLATLRMAPAPRQFETGQVGQEVKIIYLDDCSRRKRGEYESFILGGQDEHDEESVLRTYSCNSSLGRAIVRREVGEEVLIRPEHGPSYKIMIDSFSAPSECDAPAVTSSARA